MRGLASLVPLHVVDVWSSTLSSGDWAQLLPLVLIAVVFWLLILRPARRRQQSALRLQQGLGVGDRVMLTSGVFGTVRSLGDENFDLEVAAGVVLTVLRQAVAKVVEPAAAPDAEADTGPDASSQSDHGGDARP